MNTQIRTMLTVALLFAATFSKAQAPQGFNYQAVVRDGAGSLITSGIVNLEFTIRKSTASGTTVYKETQTATPNQYGQVATVIGSGAVVSGTFTSIAWGSDNYFIETKVNGTSVSNTQFQSVPYALEAGHFENKTIIPNGGYILTDANSGNIIFSQYGQTPFFPENLKDGFNCVIVNYSNYVLPSNVLSIARFFNKTTAFNSTNNGVTSFNIPSGGTVSIHVATILGKKCYFITGDYQ